MDFTEGRIPRLVSRPQAAALLIALAVGAVYGNALEAPFAYDDNSTIVHNPAIKDLGAFVRTSLLSSPRGVSNLTFALNFAAGGLDVVGYHLVNTLIHLANALLVYALVAVAFAVPFVAAAGGPGPDDVRRRGHAPALIAALLFAVHPVQTQAVTYVVQRHASLATLFYLAAIVLYARWRLQPRPWRDGGWVRYTGALLCALLAMRSKEIAFTLPVVLAGFELLFFEGDRRRRLLGLAPFLLTMLVIPATALLAGRSLGELKGVDAFATQAMGLPPVTRGEYLLTQLRVVVTYLRLLAIPVGLRFDYDYPIERAFFSFPVLASSVALAALAAAGAWLLRASRGGDRRLRIGGFGIVWFFVTLSVESSVIPIDDVIFEHRLYLPSIGAALAVAAAISVGAERLAARPAARRLLWVAIAAWLVVLAGATVARNAIWSDPIALYEDGVSKAPGKARPHRNLADAYRERGRDDAAIGEYQAIVRINPNDALARFALGGLYWDRGRPVDAIREYRELSRILPDSRRAHVSLGRLYFEMGQLEQSEREFRTALSLDPGYGDALSGLARVLKARESRSRR